MRKQLHIRRPVIATQDHFNRLTGLTSGRKHVSDGGWMLGERGLRKADECKRDQELCEVNVHAWQPRFDSADKGDPRIGQRCQQKT